MYSSYLNDVIEKIVKRNWIVHNFQIANEKDIYNFANYRQNIDDHSVVYTIHLDVNIYQFILNSVKKDSGREEFRDAIGLVAFCQIAGIELDPTFAVYEKINYRKDQAILDEVTTDLELFHRINNTSNEELSQYALGYIESYAPIRGFEVDHEKLHTQLTQYERLTEWNSLYLMILYIVHLTQTTSLNKEDKLQNLVKWMIEEYRLSLVAIVFGVLFFGNKPLRKMVKYKAADPDKKKRSSLFNMTWDLYMLNRYFRMWTDKSPQVESMYASHDKAFNRILQVAIAIQKSESLSPIDEFISSEQIDVISELILNRKSNSERVFDSDAWSQEYRASLIAKYEKLLGVNSQSENG